MVIQLPITWVKRQLDPLTTSFLKKWLGLARCANPSLLYMSREHGGLQLPSLSTAFKKFHVSQMAQLMTSRDSCVRFVASRISQQEDVTSGRAFLPASTVRGIMIDDPGISKKNLKVSAKGSYMACDESSTFQQLQALQVQGECFQMDTDSLDIWSMAIQSVPDAIMKFSMNAILDTLPHRQNLLKWGKAQSSACCLCGAKQTLLHVLNHCNLALQQRRYDQRHDTILKHIVDFIRAHIPCGYLISADLSTEASIRPPFLLSDLQPDIVVWNQEMESAYLLELPVCLESNFYASAEWKVMKYAELVEVINSTTSYNCYLHTIQIGSRGMMDKDSLSPVKSILQCRKKHFHQFLISLSISAMTESLKIWSRCNSNCCE